jgi:hypothetical protein
MFIQGIHYPIDAHYVLVLFFCQGRGRGHIGGTLT